MPNDYKKGEGCIYFKDNEKFVRPPREIKVV